jgi:hypothetical protein
VARFETRTCQIVTCVTSFISVYRPGCSLPWTWSLAIGPLFLVAGVLTIEAAFTWVRRS